jgi:nitrogen regulatory protein P-II 1
MKKIEAIIRPEKLGNVRAAIAEAGYSGLTVWEVRGHGKQKGLKQQFRGTPYTVDVLPKIKIEIITDDDSVKKIVDAIIQSARTGTIGDGKIFISTIDDAITVRTGATGNEAL